MDGWMVVGTWRDKHDTSEKLNLWLRFVLLAANLRHHGELAQTLNTK
jgi:hypothetical protein